MLASTLKREQRDFAVAGMVSRPFFLITPLHPVRGGTLRSLMKGGRRATEEADCPIMHNGLSTRCWRSWVHHQRISPLCSPWSLPQLPESARCADRKSTRLNSSHVSISYAVFCLKKKMKQQVILNT